MRVLLRGLVILAVPLVVTLIVVRLVTLPWYPAWEYARSGFPEDPLGMSEEERLILARRGINYLSFPNRYPLDELRFADGEPVFNAREIAHMEDVRQVYNGLTVAALAALGVALIAGWVLRSRWGVAALWGAIALGGLLTVSLLVGLGLWMAVDWLGFFTAFHRVFFTGDTWLFSYSDTLIRLYPLRFWQDAGALVAITVGLVALGLAILGRAMQRRIATATGYK